MMKNSLVYTFTFVIIFSLLSIVSYLFGTVFCLSFEDPYFWLTSKDTYSSIFRIFLVILTIRLIILSSRKANNRKKQKINDTNIKKNTTPHRPTNKEIIGK